MDVQRKPREGEGKFFFKHDSVGEGDTAEEEEKPAESIEQRKEDQDDCEKFESIREEEFSLFAKNINDKGKEENEKTLGDFHKTEKKKKEGKRDDGKEGREEKTEEAKQTEYETHEDEQENGETKENEGGVEEEEDDEEEENEESEEEDSELFMRSSTAPASLYLIDKYNKRKESLLRNSVRAKTGTAAIKSFTDNRQHDNSKNEQQRNYTRTFLYRLMEKLNRYSLTKKITAYLRNKERNKHIFVTTLVVVALVLFIYISIDNIECIYSKFPFFSYFYHTKKQADSDGRYELYKNAFNEYIQISSSFQLNRKSNDDFSSDAFNNNTFGKNSNKTRVGQEEKNVQDKTTECRDGVFFPVSPPRLEIKKQDDGVGVFIKKGNNVKVKKGAVLIRIRKEYALSPFMTSSFGIKLQEALKEGKLTEELAIACHLINERRKGSSSVMYSLIKCLPSLSWFQTNGIFAIPEEEFKLIAYGTSMEEMQTEVFAERQKIFSFMTSEHSARMHAPDVPVTMKEVSWALILVKSNRHFVTHTKREEGEEVRGGLNDRNSERRRSGIIKETGQYDSEESIAFIPPLYFARPSSNSQHSVTIAYNSACECLDVLATADMEEGDEVHLYDSTLSDATVFLYRGLWLRDSHRMLLRLQTAASLKVFDQKTQNDEFMSHILEIYGCNASPLLIWITTGGGLDNSLISCLRLLIASEVPSRVLRLYEEGWFASWPFTVAISRNNELRTTRFAISSIQQQLEMLLSTDNEIRAKFGNEPVAHHAMSKVREVEAELLTETLQLLRNLYTFASDEDLFYVFQQAEEGQQRKFLDG